MSNEWINTTKNLVKKLSNVIYVRRNQAGIQLEETSTFRFCYDNKENCYKNSKNWSKQRLIQFHLSIYISSRTYGLCPSRVWKPIIFVNNKVCDRKFASESWDMKIRTKATPTCWKPTKANFFRPSPMRLLCAHDLQIHKYIEKWVEILPEVAFLFPT